jgi:multidrug efflux pump subunit AcrB
MDSAGYYWFGDKKQQRQLLWIILLSIFIVWMISAVLFESFAKPFLILLAIPLSLIGLFYSFYLLDATFDQGGYASILLLVGIVVNNSIILVSHISNAIQRNGPPPTVIFKAASERIRPIFMTTITTIVGLLPLVLYETTESIWYPIAVGTIGGVLGSAVLLLFFLPFVVYFVSGKE